MARIKFKHLFIEKTVDKINNNIVDKSENLTYKIRVKNGGDNDYSYNLHVLEELSEKVEFINTKYTQLDVTSFEKNESERRL